MIRKSAPILIAFLVLLAADCYALDPTLRDIIVTNTRDDLLVYMNVNDAFHEEMKAAILNGVPISFSFLITLKKERALWFDKTYADFKVTHTIKYNALKKEFTIQRSWQPDEPFITQSFEAAQKKMTEIDGLKIATLASLEKGQRYQLRAKAELSKKTLPFYLHYVFFFVSLWDFETDWYEVVFIY